MASVVSPLHFLMWSNGTSTTAEPVNESAIWVAPTLPPVSLTTAVPMTLVYVLILVAGLVGNLCTCIVIARNKYMHTATNYYLFSLAVSDLLLLTLGLPHELLHLWAPEPYLFGEAVCVFRGLAAETSTNATILTITAFTVERYVAICYPLRSRTVSKLSRALRLLLVVWVVAAACALPIALQFGITYAGLPPDPATATCNVKTPLPHAFELSTFLFFCLPMTVISVLYLRIAVKLRRSTAPPGPGTAGAEGGSGSAAGYLDGVGNTSQMVVSDLASQSVSHHQLHAVHKEEQQAEQQAHKFRHSGPTTCNSRKAVIKMLVAVVVAFFVCWAPFHAQRLLAVYASQPPTPAVVVVYNVLTYLSGILYYVSATVNPILYHIMSLKFRLAFRETLSRCCAGRRNASRPSKCHSLSHFPSTIRSRNLTLESTDTTLLRDEEAAVLVNGALPKIYPAACGALASSPLHPNGHHHQLHSRGDSISNSSLQMLEDEALSPLELSALMADLNRKRTWVDQQRYL